ncbi:BMP family protein [Bdellovibrio bacteriovorus]|uniref:BMP family lipoprotein n=1 Tax=Bdellovibrio bacteriovorus TaxID=959 RepID=UPI0035A94EB8
MVKAILTSLFLVLFNIVSYANPIKVGLVLDKGGKDDKSFNSAAYMGATKAEKDLKIDLKYVEATDTNAIENLHRSFARKNFDLVIGIGFAQKEAVKKSGGSISERKVCDRRWRNRCKERSFPSFRRA